MNANIEIRLFSLSHLYFILLRHQNCNYECDILAINYKGNYIVIFILSYIF